MSAIGSPTYELSRYLANTLLPLQNCGIYLPLRILGQDTPLIFPASEIRFRRPTDAEHYFKILLIEHAY